MAEPKKDEFLKHPQVEKSVPNQKHLTNDHAAHLHHPQVQSEGMKSYDPDGVKPFDPKKGFGHDDC